jgi:hypothetical protein
VPVAVAFAVVACAVAEVCIVVRLCGVAAGGEVLPPLVHDLKTRVLFVVMGTNQVPGTSSGSNQLTSQQSRLFSRLFIKSREDLGLRNPLVRRI